MKYVPVNDDLYLDKLGLSDDTIIPIPKSIYNAIRQQAWTEAKRAGK